MQPDDAYWQRPAHSGSIPAEPVTPGPVGPVPPKPVAYHGPPPNQPPPRGWRIPHYLELPPPRALPGQDHDRLDAEEARARTLTYGFGMVSMAVLVVVVAVLCGRYFF